MFLTNANSSSAKEISVKVSLHLKLDFPVEFHMRVIASILNIESIPLPYNTTPCLYFNLKHVLSAPNTFTTSTFYSDNIFLQ